MRSIQIGAPPFLFAPSHICVLNEIFCSAYPFPGVGPMLLVRVAKVGVASCLRSLDLTTQNLRPFSPREIAHFRQMHSQRKSLRFPGLVEDRAFLVAWQRRKIGASHSSIFH